MPNDVVPPESRDGLVSGRVVITFVEGEPIELEVLYSNFSDDGEYILDGYERSSFTPGLAGTATYDADIVLSGEHTGFLRADNVRMDVAGIQPAVVSELDGNRLELSLP